MVKIVIIVVNCCKSHWKFILDIVSLVAGLCVSFISLYGAYLRFLCKKVKFVSYAYNSSTFYGDKIAIVIDNLSMSSISIKAIDIVYDNRYKLALLTFDEPVVLEPLKAKTFVTNMITSTYPVSLSDLSKSNNIFLIIDTTTKGHIYSPWQNKWILKKNLSNLTQVSTHTRRFNDLTMSSAVRYILLLKQENSGLKTVFILPNGLMSEYIFSFNKIPEEYMKTVEDMQKYIGEFLSPFKVQFEIRLVE